MINEFGSPRKPSDGEESEWKAHGDLRGNPAELEKLQVDFPETTGMSMVQEVERKGKMVVLGRFMGKTRMAEKLAYQCGGCDGLFYGPPKIENEQSLGVQPLAGREGYDMYCHGCNAHLDGFTFVQS